MIAENLQKIKSGLPPEIKLVAVSKFHPLDDIREAYAAGQRIFGENRPQELEKKVKELAEKGECADIQWNFLGHLQTNKLKQVLPYASLVQSIDTVHLLQEVDKWGKKNDKVINVLLELHIGAEETKQGFHEEEILELLFSASKYTNIRFCGLMGMASHTEDMETVHADFERIKAFKDYLDDLFPELADFKELSIGMSGDYEVAIDCGSTMVRIGTAIFGERNY